MSVEWTFHWGFLSVQSFYLFFSLSTVSFFSCLIHFSPQYGVISVPVIQPEGQQKSPGAWNRLGFQAESADTLCVGITLFHSWQYSLSSFFSLNMLGYPDTHLFSSHLSYYSTLNKHFFSDNCRYAVLGNEINIHIMWVPLYSCRTLMTSLV